MAQLQYTDIRKYCDWIVDYFNNKDYYSEYGTLSIYEYSAHKRPYTRIKWEAPDGWFILMSMNLKRRGYYSKKRFTDVCFQVYYNVLDMFVDLVRHHCENQSDETTHIAAMIGEISNDRKRRHS